MDSQNALPELISNGDCLGDLPPLKWSSLRYDFAMKEDDNGEEETHSGRDHREVTAS